MPGGEVVLAGRAASDESPVKGSRPTYFPDAKGYVETTVYDRTKLAVGDTLAGPAIIEDADSTLIVGPGAAVDIAATGNIIVTMPDVEGE